MSVSDPQVGDGNERVMLARFGGWRSDLVVRACGGAMMLAAFARGSWGPDPFWWLAASGVVLTVFGARMVALGVAGVGVFQAFNEANNYVGPRHIQQVEELHLWLLLCLGGACVVALASRGEGPSRRAAQDAAFVSLARVLVVLPMTFITLSKLNWDFFDMEVSCMGHLLRLIETRWRVDLGWLEAAAAGQMWLPALLVAAEAAVPLLLLLHPRVGVCCTVLVMLAIGVAGALAYTGSFIALALAFWTHDDEAAVRAAAARRPALLAVGALSLALVLALYRGTWFAGTFVVFFAATGTALLVSLQVLRARPERGTPLVADLRTAPVAARVVVAIAAAWLVWNGLCPYLGLRSRYTFSMVANLRADDTRYNSMLFPTSLLLPEHDPYVRVTSLVFEAPSEARIIEWLLPTPALYAPTDFLLRAQYLEDTGFEYRVEVRYQGKSGVFTSRDPLALGDFAGGLPSGKWYQSPLVLDGPQICIH